MAYTVTRRASCFRREGWRYIALIIAKPLAYLRAVSYYKNIDHRTAKTKNAPREADRGYARMSQKTITINGRIYDAQTGMPVQSAVLESSEKVSPKRTPLHHSKSVHATQQKSQTLNRRVVKKTPSPVTHPKIAKSPAIAKFAPRPQGATPRAMNDIAPTIHPHVTKAHQKMAAQKHPATSHVHASKPSHIIKTEALKEAIEKAPGKTSQQHKAKRTRRMPRFMSVASAALALLLLGGYLTYLNMPNLSVRVAAAQAGINASYPDYHPDGYSLKGPVGYSDGQVTMKFAANAGPQNYTVTQERSNWDSSAVLDNYVKERVGENHGTYTERGLTIYTFDGGAAWVNGGILYTIGGDAPLSSDQVRRIAVSM